MVALANELGDVVGMRRRELSEQRGGVDVVRAERGQGVGGRIDHAGELRSGARM